MWQVTNHGLYRQFNFENFKQAWLFMSHVAEIAESEQHHPRWENEWSVVQIWLISHDTEIKITEKDHHMADLIDQVLAEKSFPRRDASLPQVDKLKVFADGGSRGNPGPSASGFVVLDMEDNVIVDRGVYLGVTTNNQAEYTALKLALEECKKLRSKKIEVYMDSLLVVNQMKGIFKIRNRELWPIHQAIVELVKGFEHVSFSHVPREFNKLADAAVNRAMDDHLRSITQKESVY
jgi:ribonuclease HI